VVKLAKNGLRAVHANLKDLPQKIILRRPWVYQANIILKKVLNIMLNYKKEKDIELRPFVFEEAPLFYLY